MTHRVSDIPYSAVTPKGVYVNRRRFLAGAVGALGLARGVSAATKLSAVKTPAVDRRSR